MKKLALIIATTLLSSCASMSTSECKSANWKEVGFKDATKGRSIRLDRHTKACANIKIRPRKSLYMSGYNAGARQFCTYENGLKHGKRGKSATNICTTPALGQTFFKGYRKGKRVYEINARIKKKESSLRKIDREIRSGIKKNGKKKVTLNIRELDLLYREKELINREIRLLKSSRRRF